MVHSNLEYKGKTYLKKNGKWYSHLGARTPEMDTALDKELSIIQNEKLCVGEVKDANSAEWDKWELERIEKESIARNKSEQVAIERRLEITRKKGVMLECHKFAAFMKDEDIDNIDQFNRMITAQGRWGDFLIIRTMNFYDHNQYGTEGVTREAHEKISKILGHVQKPRAWLTSQSRY